MHQVATLRVQLGLGSALVEWYRDATTVPFGHLLIDLSPRTDDRLRYCTNSENIPSKFYVPDNLKHLKYLDDEHTNSLYSPSIPAHFPHMQNSFSKNLSKRIYHVSQRVHRQPAARKLARGKKKTRPKVERRNSRTIFKKNILEATKKSPFVAKRIIAHKNNFPFRLYSFILRWNSWFLYRFLSTTAATAQPLSQNKNYPNTNLSKLPRTTKIR